MIPGSKGHAFHVYMKMHDFGTRQNMRKSRFSQKSERFRMFCRIAEAQSAEQSVGIMGSKAFDPNNIIISKKEYRYAAYR